MKKIVKNFLPLGLTLGFGRTAELAQTSYQTVSKFAKQASNEKPNVKRRIVDAMICLTEEHIAGLQQQLDELKEWRREFLPAKESKEVNEVDAE